MDNLPLYIFSIVLIGSALKTITSRNIAYGALYLTCSMISLAGIFFVLGFPFIAGVQLVIYAGAVTVLFVMVLMLFDFQKEELKGEKSRSFKWGLPMFLFGLISGVIVLMAFSNPSFKKETTEFPLKEIALQVFTKYILIFEILGFLLLIVAIGVVALTRLSRD